jgi:hypothetical protein
MTFRPKLVTLNLVGQKTSCPNVIQPDDLSNASAAKKMCCAWVVYRGRRSSRRRVRLSIKRPHIRRPSSDGAGAFLFDCFRWVEKAATHLHRLPKSRAFHVNVAAAAEYFSLRAAIVLIARQHLTEWTKDLWIHLISSTFGPNQHSWTESPTSWLIYLIIETIGDVRKWAVNIWREDDMGGDGDGRSDVDWSTLTCQVPDFSVNNWLGATEPVPFTAHRTDYNCRITKKLF